MNSERVRQDRPARHAPGNQSSTARAHTQFQADTVSAQRINGAAPLPTHTSAQSWTFGNLPVRGPAASLAADTSAHRLTHAWPGFDFSCVRIDTSDHAAQRALSLGAPAYTEGQTIGFAPGQFAPETVEGRHVLAHELAHVVQQEHGLARGLSAGNRAALEADAEQNAHLAASGETVGLPPRIGSPARATQAFDPEYHEQATIGGLTGIFNAGEIGQIYEANWKRDFSQGPAIIADIVLTWRELRHYAEQHRGKVNSDLQSKLIKLIALLPGGMVVQPGNTYGGYRYWEHMDNPGAPDTAEADQRWGTGPGDIPGYIRDSRASLKDKLAAAIQSARDSWGGLKKDSGRTRADAWARGAPPADYDMGDAYKGRAKPPQGFNAAMNVPDPSSSSSVVADEVTSIAVQKPGSIVGVNPGEQTKGFASDPAIADNLGRASHLIEDFFAHSNFVELAQGMQAGKPVDPSSLRTGTFQGADKAHSLAGKLRDAAADMKAHKELIPLIDDSLILKLEEASAVAEAVSHQMGVQPGSHTRLAKDNPHAGPNFGMAMKLATEADRTIFWYVRRIMQTSAPDKAAKRLYILYQLVDEIINVPSDHHPLKSVFMQRQAAPTPGP
jgi:hypothetical protein